MGKLCWIANVASWLVVTSFTGVAAFSAKKKSRWGTFPDEPLAVESGLRERGYRYVIGSDEAGRGCLAGPVVAASCCLLVDDLATHRPIQGVTDSKALTAQERERIYEEMVESPDYSWNWAEKSNLQINDSNIQIATMECFAESVEGLVNMANLPVEKSYSIIDGKKNAKLSGAAKGLSCRPWVKGDANVYTVALASIVAKVTRDKIMVEEAHKKYPQYGFDKNKGYGTRDHVVAIHTHGPSPIHRMSFKALKDR